MAIKLMSQPGSWRSFEDDSIEAYTPILNEPIIDRRHGQVVLRIGDGVTPAGNPIPVGARMRVKRPVVTSPVHGATNIVPSPILTSSAFSATHPDGLVATHIGTFWQIATDPLFNDVVFDSGLDTENLTRLDLAKHQVKLTVRRQHYIRVRHLADNQILSEWSGVASVYVSRPLPLTLLGEFRASDTAAGHELGEGLSLTDDGNWAAIGAKGRNSNAGGVYIYKRDGSTWEEHQLIEPAGLSADDKLHSAQLSATANLLVVGAGMMTQGGVPAVGQAWIYRLTNTDQWSSVSPLIPPSVTGDVLNFGSTVATDRHGTRVAIGARKSTVGAQTNAGKVFIYRVDDWDGATLEAELAPPASAGAGQFGSHIRFSPDGKRLVVGAPETTVSGFTRCGTIYLYRRLENNTWVLEQTLTPPSPQQDHIFGWGAHFAREGNRLVCSSGGLDIGEFTNLGGVFIYDRIGGEMRHVHTLRGSLTVANDWFGSGVGVSADGEVIVVNSRWADRGGIQNVGAFTVFTFEGGAWVEKLDVVPGPQVQGSLNSWNISLSADGSKLLVGSIDNATLGTKAGSFRIYG